MLDPASALHRFSFAFPGRIGPYIFLRLRSLTLEAAIRSLILTNNPSRRFRLFDMVVLPPVVLPPRTPAELLRQTPRRHS